MYPTSVPPLPLPAAAEVADLAQRTAGAQLSALTTVMAATAAWWTTILTAPFTAAEHAARLIQPEAPKPDAYRHQPEG
jgi:hypothetical protein